MYSRGRLEPKKTWFHTYETGRRYGTSSFLKSEFDPIVSSSLFDKFTVERDASRLGEVVAPRNQIQSYSSPILSGAQTSVPEAKKEGQEQEVVLSQPSSSATTTVVVANGDPPFRKAEHLFLVYRSTPRRGMCTSSNNKNGTIGSYAGSISGYRSNHLNSPFLACYSYESLSTAGMGDYRREKAKDILLKCKCKSNEIPLAVLITRSSAEPSLPWSSLCLCLRSLGSARYPPGRIHTLLCSSFAVGHGNAAGGYGDTSAREYKSSERCSRGCKPDGTQLGFGRYGTKSCRAGRLSYRAIEAARRAIIGHFHRAMSGQFRRNGKIWVRVFADIPITGKPTEVRMGRGKGNPTGWIARVSTGQILFEMAGAKCLFLNEGSGKTLRERDILLFRIAEIVRLFQAYDPDTLSGASPRVAKGAASSIADVRYATEVSQAAQYSTSLNTSILLEVRKTYRLKSENQSKKTPATSNGGGPRNYPTPRTENHLPVPVLSSPSAAEKMKSAERKFNGAERYSDIKERTGKESTKREPPERQALLSQRGKTGGERDISIE
nr:ribosomal protein L16 [Ipomoea trifida]